MEEKKEKVNIVLEVSDGYIGHNAILPEDEKEKEE